jgi:AraC-like DNA-binding protein
MLLSTNNFKNNEIHFFDKANVISNNKENKEIIKYLEEINIKDSNELKVIISDIIIKYKEKKIDDNYSMFLNDFDCLNEKDRLLIQSLINDVLSNLNYEINIYDMAYKYNFSEKSFTRKLKYLINKTPSQFIKTIKLKKAKEMIKNSLFSTVSEVSYAIGYNDTYYFTKIFLNEFGISPKQLLKN